MRKVCFHSRILHRVRSEVFSYNGKKETFAYDQMDQLIRETKKDGSVNEYKNDGFRNQIYQKIDNKEAVTSTYNRISSQRMEKKPSNMINMETE